MASAALHGGMSVPSLPREKHGPFPSGKSPRKADVARPFFPQKINDAYDKAREDAREIIIAAFGGPSENATCETASRHLGCDPGTIRGILRQETKHPSFPLLLAAMSFIPEPWAVPGIQRFVAEVMRK